ncbi:MAG: hypothetical protein GX593_06770 [Actinomycetales bacterium]|nr:hypothetical protein [Actinomycetales bacterium]
MSLAAALAADPDARSRHLLVLRAGAETEILGELARARFTAARWEGSADDGAPRVLRLSRHSTLAGPFAVGRAESMDLQLPAWGEVAWVVRAPRERGDPPWDVGGDRDGLKRVFAAGEPVRDEARVVEWLVDVARHLDGAVRFGDPGAVVVPDPLAEVDTTVYSGVWLEPDAALQVARRVAAQARLATEPHGWAGPAPVDLRTLGVAPQPEAERVALHADADTSDLAAVRGPDELDGYGIEIDLDIDGMISFEAYGETDPPPAVVGETWAAHGVVAYRVTWFWDDDDEAHAERPPMELRVARGRAAPLVDSLVAALAEATAPTVALTSVGFPAR